MNSLFTQPNVQVEILNFQTFTSEYIAERYGVSKQTIIDHKRNHADEIVENIHFIYELADTKGGKQEILKWTLRGIIKLGMFIRSKEAKNFRLWAEQELEKTILSELAQAKETKARNVELSHKYADLEAYAKFEAKRHGDQINGYLGQLAKHNALIASLKTELAKRGKIYDAEIIEKYEDREENLRAELHNAKAERDFYFKRTQELKQKQNIKDSEIVRLLNKIQYQMDGVYSEIGAVMAYANDNDRFFIEQNQILKG